MAKPNEPIELIIHTLRYVKVRRVWAGREQDVLEIWRLDSTYPHPTWQLPREPANLHVWMMFDALTGWPGVRKSARIEYPRLVPNKEE